MAAEIGAVAGRSRFRLYCWSSDVKGVLCVEGVNLPAGISNMSAASEFYSLASC